MKRYIIITFLKLFVYILLFFALHFFFENLIIVPTVLTIIFFIFADRYLQEILFKNISKLFFPKIAKIERTLSKVNVKINGIIDYKLLLKELYGLFNNIFHEPQWILYILENKSFMLTRSNQIKIKLPVEILWSYNEDLKLYYDLESQDNTISFKDETHLQNFVSQNLNLLIPVNDLFSPLF